MTPDEIQRALEAPVQQAYIASSSSQEWRTPPYILDAVVKALGHIGLDPTSHQSKNTPATVHWTRENNSLGARPWRADTVFMNPPYGSDVGLFVSRFRAEYEAGSFRSGIVLVGARTDTEWFKDMWSADVLCFKHKRIQFIGPFDVPVPGTTFPSVLGYWGKRPREFLAAMAPVGRCVLPVPLDLVSLPTAMRPQ